jgi:hypothetical protein
MIISTSHKNPNNKSQYARRRSIWKGRREQLFEVVDGLKAKGGLVVYEEFSPSRMGRYTKRSRTPNVLEAFTDNWGIVKFWEKTSGVVPSLQPFTAQNQLKPARVDRIPNQELKSDFKLIIGDLSYLVIGRGFDWAPHAYLAVFVGNNWLELIASKNGNMKGHHFYHWQAVARGAPGVGHTVDDASVQDDASLGEDKD